MTGTRRRTRRLIGTAVVAAGLLVSCSDDPGPTPEELRDERIETRLGATFPDVQARCIVAGLDEPTLAALDRDADLEGDALVTYSSVVANCVEDPDSGGTTTTAAPADPTTTTTPPAEQPPAEGEG